MSCPRIAVDARPLCHPGTGIYRYTMEMLLQMCPMGGEWLLLSPQAYDARALPFDNVSHYWGGDERVPGVVASQYLYPRWLKRHAAEVFWSPRHHLPWFLPRDLPSVVSIHDLVWLHHGDTMRLAGRLLEAVFMPRALRQATHVVATSEFTAAELCRAYPFLAGKSDVVPGASHLPAASGEAVSEPGEDYFLFVGTPEPRKNLGRLLRAYGDYVQRVPAPHPLVIVGGGGWGSVDLQGQVRELALEQWVSIRGRVDDDELARLYDQAYATLLPSLYEGFGLPVVESLSRGVPVVVSRGSALEEVAGKAGVLVDPYSEQNICDALCAITTDVQLYRELISCAPAEAARYSWKRSAQTLYRLLGELAAPA